VLSKEKRVNNKFFFFFLVRKNKYIKSLVHLHTLLSVV
jgi:hypothetical protein